ncbi:MAG: flavin reductase family protein [Micrococcus sp.]|nr:flavin reductase family protein [Micrococcus sp.]
MSEHAAGIHHQDFRDVMGHYPTGVVVVCGLVEGEPVGMVVGTFSSVSLDPPMVSFMPARTSQTYARLRQAQRVCISVLAHDQLEACRRLASRDPDKFAAVAWTPGPDGVPSIDDAVAHIHGRLSQEIEAGDHYISLVEVDDLHVTRPTTPLLFFQGGYGGFSTHGLSAHLDASLISAVHVAERARPQLDALAARFDCTATALIQVTELDQTIGASSYGPDSEADQRIGVRIPLIPPIGISAVAWSPEHAAAWARRTAPGGVDAAGYEAMAERVRELGYSMSLIDDDGAAWSALGEALEQWGAGQLAPAEDREVRRRIAEATRYFGSGIDADAQGLRIATLSVPVLDPATGENSGMVLRLSGLQRPASGATALGWVDALTEAAAEVTAVLAAEGARDYERYRTEGLRSC